MRLKGSFHFVVLYVGHDFSLLCPQFYLLITGGAMWHLTEMYSNSEKETSELYIGNPTAREYFSLRLSKICLLKSWIPFKLKIFCSSKLNWENFPMFYWNCYFFSLRTCYLWVHDRFCMVLDVTKFICQYIHVPSLLCLCMFPTYQELVSCLLHVLFCL